MDRIGELRKSAQVKINLGCGETPFDGFVNIDIQTAPCKPDLVADVRQLPFSDSSVDYIECHQVLEHFELDEGNKALKEWSRILKPQGYILVTVPDILCFAQGFMKSLGHIPEVWPGVVRYIYGGLGEFNRHLSCFSPPYLMYKMGEYGFHCITDPWQDRATPSFAVLGCKVK